MFAIFEIINGRATQVSVRMKKEEAEEFKIRLDKAHDRRTAESRLEVRAA